MTLPTLRLDTKVPFWEAFRFWLKLGFINFGGPTGQIAIMHSELVEKKQWISESRFLHALNYCMFLPGPEAQQLAIYIGWLLHRTIGGIIAGSFFVLPSIFFLWALSYIYVEYGKVFWISSIFYGLKGAVTAIVAAAVIRIGKRALKNEVMWMIAAAAFISIFFLKVPFPIIILAAGFIGFLGGQFLPKKFHVIEMKHDVDDISMHTKPSLLRSIKVILVCLFLWWAPLLIIGQWLGRNHTILQEGIFFSKAAMVTFGGAYAMLPYVAQQAVEKYHWLQAGQMLDGLGLAETTPGPLIMVVLFVGFLGAWNQPGELSPLLAGSIGALTTVWTTFVPSFLWIFLGAPYIEQLRQNVQLSATLSAVTAAVVGVVMNLALWFALHTMIPSVTSIDWFLLVVSAGCFIALTKWNLKIIPVILVSAILGLIYKLL